MRQSHKTDIRRRPLTVANMEEFNKFLDAYNSNPDENIVLQSIKREFTSPQVNISDYHRRYSSPRSAYLDNSFNSPSRQTRENYIIKKEVRKSLNFNQPINNHSQKFYSPREHSNIRRTQSVKNPTRKSRLLIYEELYGTFV